MDSRLHARYQARAKVIKAMAHPSRLMIVDQLAEAGERCVCELTDVVGADMSTVSKHLTVLRQAGIVEHEKRGAMVFYRLRVPCIAEFLGCVESVLRRNADEQQALVQLDTQPRSANAQGKR